MGQNRVDWDLTPLPEGDYRLRFEAYDRFHSPLVAYSNTVVCVRRSIDNAFGQALDNADLPWFTTAEPTAGGITSAESYSGGTSVDVGMLNSQIGTIVRGPCRLEFAGLGYSEWGWGTMNATVEGATFPASDSSANEFSFDIGSDAWTTMSIDIGAGYHSVWWGGDCYLDSVRVIPVMDVLLGDDFPRVGGSIRGSLDGWNSFGFAAGSPLAWPDFESSQSVYRAHVVADPTRFRVGGLSTNWAEWMPYSLVGPDKYVRAKFFVFAGGQTHPSDGNEIPNMRLRAAVRFAQNSMIEVFNHNNGELDPSQKAMDQELRPSTNPLNPSVYRVDIDPVDVPYLASNATAGTLEGVLRAVEAYAIYPQDNGYIAMAESVIGTYPREALPDTVVPAKIYEPTATDAGSLKKNSSVELDVCNLVLAPVEGVFAERDTTSPQPTYHEGSDGITLDSTAVPTNRVGLVSREISPGTVLSDLVRVEAGKQYKVRWHITSTQQSNCNSQFRMRARAVKFAWSQKTEIGGAWGTGGSIGQPNANNSIAQQLLPGIECQNPDRNTGDTRGAWYTMLVPTPMSADIRPEFAPDTPLDARMPMICAQPGPGVNTASRRDLRFGCDLLDTLSAGDFRDLEKGNFTVDRIEVRVYDLVPD